MKKKFKLLLSVTLLILFFVCLSGCNVFKKDSTSINEKINSEISYLDGELVTIANELNNISYEKYRVKVLEVPKESNKSNESEDSESENKSSDSESGGSQESKSSESEGGQDSKSGEGGSSQDSQSSESGNKKNSDSKSDEKNYEMRPGNILGSEIVINWEELISKIETLYTGWTTIAIDLKEIGVSQEQINSFNNLIDQMAVAIKNKDKNLTLDNIISIYELLPKFEEMNQNEEKKYILECKYNLLKCYKYADMENWDEFNNLINNLKMSYSNIISKKDKYKGKISNIESGSVIINEMSNMQNIKDKEVFFIKYKNLMQELNYIEGSGSK